MYAYDIEEQLHKEFQQKLEIDKIENAKLLSKDSISEGSGLLNEEADFVMFFNILHSEETDDILIL